MRTILVLIVLVGCIGDYEDEDDNLGSVEQAVLSATCSGICGGAADGGCVCTPGCQWTGKCCSDVATYCQGTGPGQDNFTQGLAFNKVVQPAEAYIGSHGTSGEVLTKYEFVAMTGPGQNALIGLTKMAVADIDSGNEWSRCSVGSGGGGLPGMSVMAYVDYNDNRTTCGGGAMQGPNIPGVVQVGNVSRTTGSAGTSTACLNGAATDFVYLGSASFADVDDNSLYETDCNVQWVGGTCGWQLSGVTTSDGKLMCQASRVVPVAGMVTSGPFVASAWSEENNTGGPIMQKYKKDRWRAYQDTAMGNDHDRVCFLSRIRLADVDDGFEKATCEIFSKKGRWTLRAIANGWNSDLDADVDCQARCATLPSANRWPPATTATIGGLDGGRAQLFQSGPYDKPVLFFEGFDPSNKLGARYWAQTGGGLFKKMLDAGMDIWIYDYADAGRDVLKDAREIAWLANYAASYGSWTSTYPGKKFPAIGVSMGAVAGRVAMASWEQGKYNTNATDPEYIAGLGSNPISIFIAVVGPQNGGNIPLSVQTMVQDFGDFQDVGESYDALNSRAAVNMMNERISPACNNVVTEWCNSPLGVANILGTHGDYTVRKVPTLSVHGPTVTGSDGSVRTCAMDTVGCVRHPSASPNTACMEYATPAASFYADVNSRGLRSNGFATDVTNIGIATSGFFFQGDQWMQPSYCYKLADGTLSPSCTGTYFTTNTRLGRLRVTDTGHGSILGLIPLGWCDRNTITNAYMTSSDLRPGDLSERRVSDLNVEQGNTLDILISQDMPFMHIPTTSALACPGAATHGACETQNNQNYRFNRIFSTYNKSQNLGFNEYHGDISAGSAEQASWILAIVWDGLTNQVASDGDGLISATTANPFKQAIHTPFDSNDAVRAGWPPVVPTGTCGEASCVPVSGAMYGSHFTGLGCTGLEHYYTPYGSGTTQPNPDGKRYSWNGTGLAGTIYRTVTNKSFKTTAGVCTDSWPAGNTLPNFVRIYR